MGASQASYIMFGSGALSKREKVISMRHDEVMKADVVVIGGGPGGIAAAVSASRAGAGVILVERMGYLGGQLGSGLPLLAYLDDNRNLIYGSFPKEIVDRLVEMNGSYGNTYCPFHLSTTAVHPFYSRIICFQLAKENNIELLMHCELSDVEVTNNKVTAVCVTGKGAAIRLEGKVFIDATGDGDVAYMAGAAYEKGQEETNVLQPPTLMFHLAGIDFDAFYDYIESHPEELPYDLGLKHIREGYNGEFFRNNPSHVFFGLNHLIKKLQDEGKCPISRDTVIYIKQPIPGEIAVNTIRILNFDGSNVHDLSKGEMEAHLQIMPIIEMLKEHVPGFEECYLTSINPTIGVRESRRIMGVKKLSYKEAQAGVITEDAIGLCTYFIDIHSGNTPETYTKRVAKPYGIPYGCTVAREINGLMMSGRCISVDAITFGSSRIMGSCMAVGEAAGVGAALAVKEQKEPREVDPKAVRKVLMERGAVLEA